MNPRSLAHRLLAVCAAIAFVVLVGRITDRTTGQSLSRLTVTLTGPSHASTRTGPDGRYRLRRLRPGLYRLVIRGKGVPTVRTQIKLEGREVTKDFVVCNIALDYSCSNPPQ